LAKLRYGPIQPFYPAAAVPTTVLPGPRGFHTPPPARPDVPAGECLRPQPPAASLIGDDPTAPVRQRPTPRAVTPLWATARTPGSQPCHSTAGSRSPVCSSVSRSSPPPIRRSG